MRKIIVGIVLPMMAMSVFAGRETVIRFWDPSYSQGVSTISLRWQSEIISPTSFGVVSGPYQGPYSLYRDGELYDTFNTSGNSWRDCDVKVGETYHYKLIGNDTTIIDTNILCTAQEVYRAEKPNYTVSCHGGMLEVPFYAGIQRVNGDNTPGGWTMGKDRDSTWVSFYTPIGDPVLHGTGNGTKEFKVKPNTTSATRAATVFINPSHHVFGLCYDPSSSFTITQCGAAVNEEAADGISWECSTNSDGTVSIGCSVDESHTAIARDTSGAVVVPSTLNGGRVTRIGAGAFDGCDQVTSIVIPEGVEEIGARAFRNCSALTEVTIPSSVTQIGDGAFEGCSSLTMVRVEAGDAARVRRLLNEAGCDMDKVACVEPQSVTLVIDGVETNLVLVVGEPWGELPDPGTAPLGHSFAGWYTGPDGTGTKIEPSTIVAADVSGLYQFWSPNGYTVSFDANGGTGKMSAQAFVYDVAQGLTPNAFTREGWTFVGWAANAAGAVVYADGAKVSNLTVAADGEVTLFAVWERVPVNPVTPVEPVDPTPVNPVNPVEPTPVEPVAEIPELYTDDVQVIPETETAPYELAAAVYDGYIRDAEGDVKGTVQVKVAKGKVNKKTGAFEAKVTATVQLADGSKKLSFKGVADERGLVSSMAINGHALDITLGVNGVGGAFDGLYATAGARNLFSAKAAADKAAGAAALNVWQGAINVVADGVALSVTVANKGKAKVAGTVNGLKVSATSQLLVGEEWCCIPVAITKKASLAFNLWLPKAGGEVMVTGLDGAIAGKTGALKSGAAFRCGEGASELARALSGVGAELLGDYLPEGVGVAQSGAKWVVAKAGKVAFVKGSTEVDAEKAGANPSGLKLTYKAKDGSFSGSFKAPAIVNGKIKSYTVNVTGVLVEGVGYGTATLKKPACTWDVRVE